MTSGTHAIIVSIALDLGITVCLACVAVKDWGGARVSDSVSSVHDIFQYPRLLPTPVPSCANYTVFSDTGKYYQYYTDWHTLIGNLGQHGSGTQGVEVHPHIHIPVCQQNASVVCTLCYTLMAVAVLYLYILNSIAYTVDNISISGCIDGWSTVPNTLISD